MPKPRRGSLSGRLERRGPEPIGNLLAELMAGSGFAGCQAARAYEKAWRDAAGPLAAAYSRPARLRRGVLEVVVASSTLVQELAFEKARLLERLQQCLPEQRIRQLRFRIGSLGDGSSFEEEPGEENR